VTALPCRADPDGWWSNDADDIAEAKRRCLTRCPALEECARAARAERPDGGVWAGRLWLNGKPTTKERPRPGPDRKECA
jgi:hypothetical protein